jgi:hypothetical protein
MRSQFGEAYATYAHQTAALVPYLFWYRKWSAVPMCLSGGQTLGIRHFRKDGLARCQEDCREHEHSTSRAA